jgi:hypothetical protein
MTAPMNSAPDPARVGEIADGLSEAQRKALIGARDLMSSHGGYAFLSVECQPGETWPQGLTQFLTLTSDRLTPLGLAVRNHIIEARNEA